VATDITEKTHNDDDELKLNRKEVIHLGFQNKTRGEAAFNLISYAGFGYFVVTATSVLATWLLRDSKAFGPTFEKQITTRFVNTRVAKFLHIDTSVMNILTLFAGGTIASVLPVKWLEDRKPKVVKKLDYMLYSEDQFYNDPKIKEAHKELDEMPKQTWLSVFGSRIVAFVATFSVLFIIGGNKSPIARLTGGSLDQGSIRFGRWMDKVVHKAEPEALALTLKTNRERMNPALGAKALGGEEVIRDAVGGDSIASRVWSYVGLDAFYTLITSASLWISTRVFGAIVGKVNKPNISAATLAAEQKESILAPFESKDVAPAPAQETTTPPTRITAPVHMERVAEPRHSAELSA
jgi:hypothetical protein